MRLQNPHKQVSNRYPTGIQQVSNRYPTGIQRHIEYAPTIGRAYAREHRFLRTDLASPLAHGAQIKQVKPATDMSAPSTMNLGCSWRKNRIGELGDRSDLSGETVEVRSRLIAANYKLWIFVLVAGMWTSEEGNRSNQVFFSTARLRKMDHFRSNLKKAGCGWCWWFRHMFLLAIIDVNPFGLGNSARTHLESGWGTWHGDFSMLYDTFCALHRMDLDLNQC